MFILRRFFQRLGGKEFGRRGYQRWRSTFGFPAWRNLRHGRVRLGTDRPLANRLDGRWGFCREFPFVLFLVHVLQAERKDQVSQAAHARCRVERGLLSLRLAFRFGGRLELKTIAPGWKPFP